MGAECDDNIGLIVNECPVPWSDGRTVDTLCQVSQPSDHEGSACGARTQG